MDNPNFEFTIADEEPIFDYEKMRDDIKNNPQENEDDLANNLYFDEEVDFSVLLNPK